MQFDNYVDFRSKTQVMLDGDDISDSDLSVSVLDLIIGAGEQRIYNGTDTMPGLRSSAMEATLSLPVSLNAGTLPGDFLEMSGGAYVAGYRIAVYTPWEDIQNLLNVCPRSGTSPIRYSVQGDSLIFYPSQDQVTLTGKYYRRFPDIAVGGLNPLFQRYPDIFLYAALAESAPFLGEKERMAVWETKFKALMGGANEQEKRRFTRGTKLATRIA